MLGMKHEEKANNGGAAAESGNPPDFDAGSHQELKRRLELVCQELQSEEPDPPGVEDVYSTREELKALSADAFQKLTGLWQEREALAQQQRELDQKGLNLGFLRLAQQAPRCSHLKSNGKPCRAPAMGNNLFCVFHGRALDTQDGPRMKVSVLEDRESLQLAVKQIMEQIVSGRIEPQSASLLLRAVQIAGSTVKPRRKRTTPRKPNRSEVGNTSGNAEENSG